MALGIIGLPIPDETILAFTGYLVSIDKLKLIPAIASAYSGSITGITVSFFLGRLLGTRVIRKYGSFLRISDEKLDKTRKWLEHYGSWMYIFGYFIPGVRHLTAIFAGSTNIRYPKFALFAYMGGLLWSITFILAGYYAGKEWTIILEKMRDHILLIMLILLFIIILYISFRIIRNKIKKKSQ